MRWLGMLATFTTLVAVFFAVASLTAFGFDWRGIVGILWPMAIFTILLSAAIFAWGRLSLKLVQRLDREKK